MFTGTIDAKIDAKGRVFLPADFRKQWPEQDERIVLKRDIYEPCLIIYPYSVWGEEVTNLRHRINRHDARQAMLFRQFMAGAEVLALDANGRLLISKRLLAAAQLESHVRFIGLDERIELWSAELMDRSFLSDAELAQGMQNLLGHATDDGF